MTVPKREDGGAPRMGAAPRPRDHLAGLSRDSDCLGERTRFVCLDRNERPSPWPEADFRAALATLKPTDFNHYPDLGPLYERLVRATGLPQARLAVGAGSDALIRRALHAYLRPGDKLLSPDPSYGMYAVWARIFEAEHVAVPYGADLRLDLDGFIARIETARPRVVAIANADQPTGAMLARDSLLAIVDACARTGALCLVDEAYHPFSPVTLLGDVRDRPSLLVLRSFSKSGGIAGLRVGFAAGDAEAIRALHAVRSPGEVASLSAAIACYLLDRPEIFERHRAEVEEGRARLLAAAASLGFECPPCHGNFQLVRTAPLAPKALAAALERRGYLVRAGFGFAPLKDAIRVTLDGPAVIDPFVAALEESCAELRAAAAPAGT